MFMDSRPAIRAGLFSVTLLIVTLPISNIARAFERKSRPKFPRPYCRGPVAGSRSGLRGHRGMGAGERRRRHCVHDRELKEVGPPSRWSLRRLRLPARAAR